MCVYQQGMPCIRKPAFLRWTIPFSMVIPSSGADAQHWISIALTREKGAWLPDYPGVVLSADDQRKPSLMRNADSGASLPFCRRRLGSTAAVIAAVSSVPPRKALIRPAIAKLSDSA